MADNVAITAGSGTTIAADEVVDGTLGTVKVQYVKLMDGALDGSTKGVIGANGLKADVSGSYPFAPETTSSLGAGSTGTLTTRDSGTATATDNRWAYFSGTSQHATLPHTLIIEGSNDNFSTSFELASVVASLTVNSAYSAFVQVPLQMRYYRLKIKNTHGATSGTFNSFTSFSGA